MHEHTVAPNDQPVSSVEIASRAKGPPAVTVKVYHQDPDTAAKEALRIYAFTLQALAHYGAASPTETE